MIGLQFRKLRIQRHLTLREVATDIVSVSLLSRFERGDADIHIHQLLSILDRIGVSLVEFASEIDSNNGSSGTFEDLVKKAYERNDSKALAMMALIKIKSYHDSGKFYLLYEGATAANCYADLTGNVLLNKQDRLIIESRLSDTVYWGIQEIRMFSNVTLLIPCSLALSMSLLLCDELPELSKQSYIAVDEAWTVLLNVLYSLMLRRNTNSASKLWNRLKGEPLDSGLLFIQTRRYFLGMLLRGLKGGDVAAEVHHLCSWIDSVGSRQLALNFEEAYDHVISYEH